MWDLVKGLRKVQQDHVCLTFIIQAFGKVINSEQELCLTRPLFPESMLSIRQNAIGVKIVTDGRIDNMHNLQRIDVSEIGR